MRISLGSWHPNERFLVAVLLVTSVLQTCAASTSFPRRGIAASTQTKTSNSPRAAVGTVCKHSMHACMKCMHQAPICMHDAPKLNVVMQITLTVVVNLHMQLTYRCRAQVLKLVDEKLQTAWHITWHQTAILICRCNTCLHVIIGA